MTKSLNLKNQLRKFISCFGQLNHFHLILASENIGSLFRTNPILSVSIFCGKTPYHPEFDSTWWIYKLIQIVNQIVSSTNRIVARNGGANHSPCFKHWSKNPIKYSKLLPRYNTGNYCMKQQKGHQTLVFRSIEVNKSESFISQLYIAFLTLMIFKMSSIIHLRSIISQGMTLQR